MMNGKLHKNAKTNKNAKTQKNENTQTNEKNTHKNKKRKHIFFYPLSKYHSRFFESRDSVIQPRRSRIYPILFL